MKYETPINAQTVTVYGTLWTGAIIGHHFFKNDDDHTETVKVSAIGAYPNIFETKSMLLMWKICNFSKKVQVTHRGNLYCIERLEVALFHATMTSTRSRDHAISLLVCRDGKRHDNRLCRYALFCPAL